MANDSTKWLYEQLTEKGYNVGKDVDEFESLMHNNTDSRQWAYNTATKSGLNVGKDFDEFSSLVGGPAKGDSDYPAKDVDATGTSPEPIVEISNRPLTTGYDKDPAKDWGSDEKREFDKSAIKAPALRRILDRHDRQMEEGRNVLENTVDYYKRGGVHADYAMTAVKGDMEPNFKTGKVEQTYLTPVGMKTNDKDAADRITKDNSDYNDNLTIAGQLRRAGRDLTDLHRKREARVKAIHERWKADQEKNTAPLAAVLGAQTYTPSIQSDPEYRALTAAIHQAEKRVQTLQHENDRQNGKDVGFWRGFGEVVGDIRTWDFGYSDLLDGMTMLEATREPSSKRPAKTEDQKAAEQIMLEQTYEAQQAQAEYGQNDSFWNRAGVMTGEMLPFMLDFAIMGGAKSGSSTITRNIDTILLRGLHKAAPKVAQNKAVQWTTKVLGALPEDLLYRAPLMTNTVQGMKTAADIIDRKLGDVVIRDDGTYDFSNDKTWGSAIWQGEANAIIENYSEMFGTHLEGIVSLGSASKLADVFGAKRLSGILTKASNSELAGIAGTMQKHLNQLGVSDYLGEVGEEYYGQLWRTMLNLDDAYKQNPDGSRTNLFLDGQFHGDIWGGMALSMGLMGAGKYSLSAAAYGSMKHRVNKADMKASEIFTPEVWENWRKRIDGTTNDKIGGVAEAIVADPTLTDEQKAAAMDYTEATLNLRGHNLASVARGRGGETSAEEIAANESYMDGYSATTPQEMGDAKKMLDLQRQRLASSLSEDVAQEFEADPIGALSRTIDPEMKNIATDFVNAKSVYDGMIQRVRDDIDGRIAQSDAMIDSRVNRETGMIQPATMKTDDRKVYIINGSVSMYEDGSGVDASNSSESIIVRDAETGKVEFVDPMQILGVDESIDAETEKEAARKQITDEIAITAANNIDGVLSFNPSDTYSILDTESNPQEISVLGQTVDENGIPVGGTVDIQLPDGSIESVATADLQQRADAASAKRVAQFDQERQAQRPDVASDHQDTDELQQEPQVGSEAVEAVASEENGPQNSEQGSVASEDPKLTAVSKIPVDEHGELKYEEAEPDVTWDALVEQTEGDEDIAAEVVADILAEREADYNKAEKELAKTAEGKPDKRKPTDPAVTMAERIAAKKASKTMLAEYQAVRDKAKKTFDYWSEVAGTKQRREQEIIKAREAEAKAEAEAEEAARKLWDETKSKMDRRLRETAEEVKEFPTAVEALQDLTPRTADEVAATLLSTHKLLWNDVLSERGGVLKKGVSSHSGYGAGEMRKLLGLFATEEKGGISIERLAEDPAKELCEDLGIRYDNSEMLDALIGVIGSSHTMSDIYGYIAKNREAEARQIYNHMLEQEAEYNENFHQEAYHQSVAEHESYEDLKDEEFNQFIINFDEQKYSGIFADELKQRQEHGLQQDRNNNGNDDRSGTLLPGSQISEAEGIGASPKGHPISEGAEHPLYHPERPLSGSTSGREEGNIDAAGSADDGAGAGGNGAVTVGQSDISTTTENAGISYQLSDEVDDNGRQFVLTPDGSLEFGRIDAETGLTDAPIKLSSGFQNPVTGKGYGFAHLKAKHGAQIQQAGFGSVEEFVSFVAQNYDRDNIRVGKRRDDGSGTFLIQAVDEHENTLFIELSKDNSYWGVNSGGIFRKGYSNKKETVAKTEPQQPNNAVSSDSSLSVDEQVGISSIEPNGESTVSGDKVTISSTEKQEDRQESSIGERIVTAETEVNTEPTQAQKEAGNYKKGHVQVGTFNVTIENPKGSVRRGTDASGKQWETTMQHTYGYIRGTEGVDGDHIDVFLSSDIDGWNGRKAFVVDQYNPDGTFDEHKVMLGFNDNDEAFSAYLSNYEKGWENGRRLDVTAVNLEDFEKWIGSSKRKTKPLAEYVRLKKSIDKTDNEASIPFSVGSDKRTDGKSYELTRQLVADAIGAENVVEVSDAEAQAMLRSHGDARLMGSRTDRKMAAIAEYYADKTLDDNQRKVVDVFSGKADNQAILVERPEGKCRVVMRQGREPKAGTKHSLFRHYETAGNYIKTDDFAKIPEVIAKGERGVTSTGITYDLTLEDGTRLRVTTKLNDRREEFTNFLSNRKPPKSEPVKNTQLSARASNSEVSDAKLGKSDDNAKFLKTASGVVYGWTSGGKVYLNRDMMNPETPLHEYTHLWDAMVRERNAELWARGVELMKQTPLWDGVVNDPRYVDISADENAIASEVHARLVGKDGAAILDDMIKRAGTDGAMAVAEAVTLKDKIQKWLSDMFNALRGTFSKFGENSLKDLTADDFNNMTLRDLVDKIDPNTEIKRGRQAERINRTNRMTDDVHTGIRTAEDVKSFDEILSEVESYGDTMYPDMGLDMMREARHSGFITVYSSKPIRDGVFVTPSRMNAEDYAGGGRVYSRRVKVDDVAWIDDSEGQLATVSEGEKSPILMSTADDDILMRSTETGHKVISDADYSKLSEVERDVLDKYLSKRKSAGLSVIETQEDIAALNLNEDARRELTEFFNDKENIACYFKPTKNIYIFADRTAEGIGADLFHENMHALVDDLSLNDGSFLREFREQILDMPGYADMLRHNLNEEIVGMYEPDIVDEEFFSYVNMWAYAKPEVRPLISDCLRGSTKEYYQSVVQNHEYYKATEDLNRYDQTKGLQQLRQSSGNAADESAENEREGGETRVVGRGNARGKIRQEEAEGSERHEGLYPGIHEYGRGRRSGIADEIESLFNQAARGDLKGKPIEIGRLTEEGRNYLERLSGVAMKKDVSFVLNPSDLAHINRRHFGKNEKDGRNIPLTKDDIREIANIVSNPDRVIYGKETTGSQRNMFFFLKECSDGSYNLMEIYSDRRGNLTAKSFFKSKEGVSQRAMSLITESSHLTSITDGATLSDGAKLPKFFSDSKQSAVEKRPGVDNFENPTVKKKESLERQGDGYGSYSDAEVSYENDPVSKVMGANRFSKKRQAEFAARERQRMAERIQELSELMHLDNVEIVTDASQLEGRRAKAKGFYSKRTGRITIIIPNHVSTIDVEQTLLHEAVAHYGLRRLFGRQFDTFLDNVYQSADESIRSKITEMAAKNSWDFRTATEEYLAGLAEDINYDEAQSYSGWWIEIKRLFFDMLEKIGFNGFKDTGIELTDNELRYLLWRSYQNLVNPGRYRAFVQEAEDVAMQHKFEVGNYAPMEEVTDGMVAEAGELNEVNERFNEALQRWEAGEMDKNEIIQIGAPLGIMKTFLPDLPIVMRQRILSKASYTKHNVDTKSLINLPRYISDPIFVFQRNENTLGIFTEMKDRDGKNICVAVELNKKIQHGKECLEVNDIRSIHGRDNENIIKPIISNNTLRYANKKKGLAWLSSASSNYQQEIDRQDLDSRIERPSSATRYVQYEIDSLRTNPAESKRIGLNLDDAAKIVENFENPTVGKHNNNAVARDGVAEAGELNDVNERFNEQLSELREDNADKTILNLGMPSAILLAGGVSDRPMKLYGNKIIKKMKKHGFRLSELRNLPNAVANPIAVFNNLGRDGNRSILTELKTANGNFLVTIDLGKGGDDIDFNVVSSVFGKGENKVINWIEKGYITYIDKKKALNYLHHPAPIAEALSSSKLNSAAKIVENFENPTVREYNNNAMESDDVLYRDGDFTPRDQKTVADYYEHMLSRGSWQFREATQDSMLGLKTLYEAILGSGMKIEDVAGYENAYLYENRMSSTNNSEQHNYFGRFMKPLLESIHKLCGDSDIDRGALTDYMMAKHGLERNGYMRNEAAASEEETERDFAGLCGLTGENDWQAAESAAQKMVDDYEAGHDTAELWNSVNNATKASLEKIYLSGLISDDTYNKILGMYKYYIPLRGWDETTSDEVYSYINGVDGRLNKNVMKKAGGRPSKADDPIAHIAQMADDAIRQGNRNIMKQRFLNFVQGNPSDLVSINDFWLHYNDAQGEWEPVFADLQPGMTYEEAESEIAKFEAKMEALRNAEPDKYKKGRDTQSVPYKVKPGDLSEHQILVKRNGRTYVMTINGNPRAAQALNGLTNPDVETGGVVGNMLKLGEYVNRHLSAFYTTRNPDFVVSNFLRDMLYSNCMTWVKENPRYALRFHRNFGKVNPRTLHSLLTKWENDSLNEGVYLEKMFKDFMKNGGETGYTAVKDIEGYKRTIASELKKQGSAGRKAWGALGMQLDLLNRSAENCARFAAFLTSREMGRTLDRSIYDAKEVSVNFNKKGSGGKFVNATGQKFLGKIGSYIGGGGRIAYVFWNAGIQGMTNFGRAAKRNPKKAITGATALFTLGYVIPLVAQMLGGGDGDDDDKNAYYNLPEYVRRSNICFKAGEQWITIPLPIEYRAIYGMGELAMGVISGNERYNDSELARQIAAQVSQVMPLDMLEGGGGITPFIPSALKPMTEAYILNKSWAGLPIYKDTPYNQNDPEWTKSYQSTDHHLVEFAKWLNETSGGDDFKKGAIDINPAKIEYLLSGTFGGAVSTIEKLKKMGETVAGDREFEWRNILLVNRVVKSGDERTANRKLQNEYFKYLNEYNETNRLRKKYENAADEGILGYAEKVDFLYNSAEYLRYEIFKKYEPDIDAIREELKEETNPEAKKELQKELIAAMREVVDKLNEVVSK